MSTDINALIQELQQPAKALVDLAGRAGVQPRVTSTIRTHAQQKRLYDAFLRGETHYPVNPPGLSAHEFGYAFDMVASTQADLHDLGTVWRSWGGVWSPNDEVHFEYPGFNPATAQAPAACSPLGRGIAEAVDLILGFAPYVGEVELAAWLVSFGFPHSAVVAWLQNPLTTTVCGVSK